MDVSLRLAGRVWPVRLTDGLDGVVLDLPAEHPDPSAVTLSELMTVGTRGATDRLCLFALWYSLRAASRHYASSTETRKRLPVVAGLLARELTRSVEDTAIWMRPPDERAALQELYARSQHAAVRHGSANSTDLQDVLSLLVFDEDPQVRWAVADNPMTTDEVRALLLDDEYAEVRGVVAARTVNLGLQTALAADADESVRLEVAEHSPYQLLLCRLAYDASRRVRKVARRHLVELTGTPRLLAGADLPNA